MAAAIRPERILKDLAKLWVDLAKEEGDKNSSGVLRACAMTLIVAVEQREDAQAVGQTIAELMHEHPSRAIVLYIEEPGTAQSENLDARVFAQCWMPFGRRQQICCEQIEITAPERILADVPKLLLALTVPDLPVVLWVRCPHMATHPEFQNLYPLASKIIIDSDCFDDPGWGYDYVARMNRRGINMMDLAWTRLTHWREMIAQMFEDERNRARLDTINAVTIVHGGSGMGARYLATWLQNALPRARVHFQGGKGESSGIARVELAGAGFSASVALEDGSTAVLKVDGLTQRTAMRATTEEALLSDELGIIGVDPVFRRCFE